MLKRKAKKSNQLGDEIEAHFQMKLETYVDKKTRTLVTQRNVYHQCAVS